MSTPPEAEPADAGEVDPPADDDEPTEAAAPTSHHLVVPPAHGGARLDAMVAASIASMSRAMVQRLLDDGHVAVNGVAAVKAGQRVRTGDAIAVTVPPPVSLELVAEPIPLSVLFEDRDVIVIDKPAGLVVHPAPGHPRGTLVNGLLHHCTDLGGIGGALRPGIVHRLDKDTSGVMVVAKTDRAHAALTAAFAAKSRGEPGRIAREYLGVAAPPPSGRAGTLRTLHERHPTDRKRFTSRAGGKPAVTHWERVETLADGGAALLRFRLETGRTHQIRVHAADHGWPLLGDPLYGRTPRDLAPLATALGRQALHAARLAFDHPASGAHLAFESPLPADFEALLAATRSST